MTYTYQIGTKPTEVYILVKISKLGNDTNMYIMDVFQNKHDAEDELIYEQDELAAEKEEIIANGETNFANVSFRIVRRTLR